MVFKGPVRPGTDEEIFRRTGITRPIRRTGTGGGFAGPVRPGRDEEIFRRTGKSVVSGSLEAKRIRDNLQKQAVAKRQRDILAKQRAEAKRLADLTEAQRQAERRRRREQEVKFEKELVRQANIKGRNLFLSERESIARKVFETEAQAKARLEQEIRERQRRPLTASQQKVFFPKAKQKLIKAFDIISGGSVTEGRLNKRQDDLNKKVEDFNEKFGGKELEQSKFDKAQELSSSMEKSQNLINRDRDELSTSFKSKIGRLIGTIEPFQRLTPKEKRSLLKGIPKQEKRLGDINFKIEELEKNKIPFSKIRIFNLKKQRTGVIRDIERRKSGEGIRVLMGELPLVPASRIPAGITKVIFLGSQRTRKGKIITDIIFKTSRGQIGLAKGVARSKLGKGVSVVVGKVGKLGVKFPSRVKKIGGIRSFSSLEKTLVKPLTLKFQRTIKLIRKAKKIGRITVVRRNIKALKQLGVGKVFSVKGKKLIFFKKGIRFPSGRFIKKLRRGISVDRFASLSAIFTKKQLSVIIGNTITARGAKTRFIGIIKGTTKLGKTFKINPSQQKQYSQALQRVIATASASVSQAQKIKGISKPVAIALASQSIVKTLPKGAFKPQKIKIITKQITRSKIKEKQITKDILKSRIKQKTIIKSKISVKQKATQIQAQKQKQKQLQRQLQKQKQKQVQKQLQRQLQKQVQKQLQRQLQKQIQRQILKTKITTPHPKAPKIPKIPIIPIISGKIKIKKKIKKAQAVFNVFGKVKKKFVKLNIKPLTKDDALSKGAFAIDHTTARTFKISSAGKSKKPGKLLKGERNYFNRQGFKLREFRIRKGRKFKLKQKYIEKRKFGIDTSGEKKGLSLRKLLVKQRRGRRGSIFSKKRRPIKRIVKRKVMLKNLAKARKVRLKGLVKKPVKRIIRRTARRSPIKKSIRSPVRRFKAKSNPKPFKKKRTLTPTKARKQPVRKTGKRVMSQKQLNNLAKGRAIRLNNLKK